MKKYMSWVSSQFELSRHGSSPVVLPMEGLRGFAVFLVFLAHYVSLISPWITKGGVLDNTAEAIHSIGNVGVDLFFVLSGYLIYASIMTRRQSFLRFMRRRVARIYPAFCVVFAVYLLLSFVVPGQSKIRGEGLPALIYILQNFLLLPGLFPIEPIITVAWSLSYEMFFYLAIPLTVAALRLRECSSQLRVVFFITVASAIAIYCGINGGHVRLIMFIAGILLHEALHKRLIPVPHSIFAIIVLLAGLGLTAIQVPGPLAFTCRVVALFVTFFIVCYVCFSRVDAWVARLFSITPLRWLGNMSYSYYLLHGLSLKLAFAALFLKLPHVEHQFFAFVMLMPVMFVLSLLPAAGLFLLVERPLSLIQALPSSVGTPVIPVVKA